MSPSFGHQATETTILKELELLQESWAWGRKELKPGASQRRNLDLKKKFHPVLTTCGNHPAGETGDRRATPRPALLMHSPLLKLKLHDSEMVQGGH